jgi:hypothetical protein
MYDLLLLKFQLLFSDVTIPGEVASTIIDLLSDECNYIEPKCKGKSFCLMVFIATFNNISVKSWRSVVFVEETGEPEENQRPVASH